MIGAADVVVHPEKIDRQLSRCREERLQILFAESRIVRTAGSGTGRSFHVGHRREPFRRHGKVFRKMADGAQQIDADLFAERPDLFGVPGNEVQMMQIFVRQNDGMSARGDERNIVITSLKAFQCIFQPAPSGGIRAEKVRNTVRDAVVHNEKQPLLSYRLCSREDRATVTISFLLMF